MASQGVAQQRSVICAAINIGNQWRKLEKVMAAKKMAKMAGEAAAAINEKINQLKEMAKSERLMKNREEATKLFWLAAAGGEASWRLA